MVNIAHIIKNARKNKGYSVKEIVSKLQCFGVEISEKTLYGWESGHRQPDADMFVILCKIYDIRNIDNLEQSEEIVPDDSYTLEVAEVVNAYNKADVAIRNSIRKLLDLPPVNLSKTPAIDASTVLDRRSAV